MSGRYRYGCFLLLAACGVRINDPSAPLDATPADADRGLLTDAATDAAIDAAPLPCVEGDARIATASGCFMFFATPKLRVDARTACTAVGAHLAYVKSADDEATIATLAGTTNSALGADDLVTENTFLWEDGTPLTYAAWATGEPNNGNGQFEEDCMVYAGTKTPPGWDDRPCAPPPAGTGSYPFICQR